MKRAGVSAGPKVKKQNFFSCLLSSNYVVFLNVVLTAAPS